MTKVTKESLERKIASLENNGFALSLNEEYQLEAYKMLRDLISECDHDWKGSYGFEHKGGFSARCRKCGVSV